MCEIAVFDPSRTEIQIAQQIAHTLYEEQGDSLGVLAISDDGEQYEYDVYKSTEPHWATLYAFFKRNWDDAWRMVIHGRYGTSGGDNRSSAHPIHVDCECCEWDYVIHNGSVRNYKRERSRLKEAGHEFNTGVDTEVIPHEVMSMPDDVTELRYSTYQMSGRLNYLLFSPDGIFVRAQRKYDLTDDLRMTCRLDEVDDLGFAAGDNRWLVARPGEDIESSESNVNTTNSTQRSVSTTTRTSSGGGTRSRGHSRSGAATWPSANGTHTSDIDNGSGDAVTISYEDHASFDDLSAIKVAPGVMRVHDEREREVEFVYRHEDPRLYYFYAPEDAPDEDALDEMAENDDTEQQALTEIVTSEAAEATNRAVGDTADVGDAVARIIDGE